MTSLSDQIILKARHADEGWSGAYPLFSRVVNTYSLKTGVEIGVAFGGHSEAILLQTQIEKLYGVDPYRHFNNYDDPMNLPQSEFDALYEFAKHRLAKFGDRFEVVREVSCAAASVIKDKIDFVYIDALHTYEGVRDDLEIWFPKVKDGGIVGGHDYGHPNFPGVKKAVDDFFKRFDWEVHEEGEGVWWVEKRPLHISFIIPTYNCELTITETINSIINGNINKGDEIVIVDDASTDGTKALLDSFVRKHDFLRVLEHSRNKGGAAARNYAVENSNNELIFCIDSDNVLVEGSIDMLKRYFIEQNADVASFQELHYFRTSVENVTHKWIFKHGKIEFADCLAGYVVPIASGNYLFTKASWLRAGGYPEFAGALDAWGFGVRQLATGSKMVVLPDSFYYHRYGHESYWTRDYKKGKTSLTALQILIPYLDLFKESDINFIVGRKWRHVWFEHLDVRPLRLKTGAAGSVGYVVNLSDTSMQPRCDTHLIKKLVAFLGRILQRFFREN